MLRGEATKTGLAQLKARREESKKYREENMYDICMVTKKKIDEVQVNPKNETDIVTHKKKEKESNIQRELNQNFQNKF